MISSSRVLVLTFFLMVGWMYDSEINVTCVDCNISGCPVGYQGYCTAGSLQCSACQWPKDKTKTFAGPGNCTIVCASPYIPRFGNGSPVLICILPAQPSSKSSSIPVITPQGSSTNNVWGVDLSSLVTGNSTSSNAVNTSTFPMRVLPHSG